MKAKNGHLPYGRHRIVFEADTDIECVIRAELGQSTKRIQEATGLSPNQITYRLSKAKVADGLPKGQGYRSTWRDGSSPTARQIFRRWGPDLRRNATKRLPPHFTRRANET